MVERVKPHKPYRYRHGWIPLNPGEVHVGRSTGHRAKPDDLAPVHRMHEVNAMSTQRRAKRAHANSAVAEAKGAAAFRNIEPGKGRVNGTGTLSDPIYVGSDLDRAQRLIAEGKHVRLNQPDEVSTILDRLAQSTKGGDKSLFDLCKMSVTLTNLFCRENKGIPRAHMPQLKGKAAPGSLAAAKGGTEKEVDVEPEFIEALKKAGISITPKRVMASHLRASQEELDGRKGVGMAEAIREGKGAHIADTPIYVSRDGYVIDGHHRWAALVAIDILDGKIANPEDNVQMNVQMIDLDIGAALDYTNEFAKLMGIKQAAVGK